VGGKAYAARQRWPLRKEALDAGRRRTRRPVFEGSGRLARGWALHGKPNVADFRRRFVNHESFLVGGPRFGIGKVCRNSFLCSRQQFLGRRDLRNRQARARGKRPARGGRTADQSGAFHSMVAIIDCPRQKPVRWTLSRSRISEGWTNESCGFSRLHFRDHGKLWKAA